MREFREETGYVGTVVGGGEGLTSFLSPGLTNESAVLVRLDVDMGLEVNRRNHRRWVRRRRIIVGDTTRRKGAESAVEAQVDAETESEAEADTSTIEDTEKARGLEVVLLPRVGLLDALMELQRRDGVDIFTGLHALAVGMAMNESTTTLAAPAAAVTTTATSAATTTTMAVEEKTKTTTGACGTRNE